MNRILQKPCTSNSFRSNKKCVHHVPKFDEERAKASARILKEIIAFENSIFSLAEAESFRHAEVIHPVVHDLIYKRTPIPITIKSVS